MNSPTDGTLLSELQRGDRQALTALIERHQGAILGHARALLGYGGAYEDVVQEVYLRLLEHPPAIPAEHVGDRDAECAHLRSWLHKVTRNCCMDVMRSEARRRVREQGAAIAETTPRHMTPGAELVEQRDTRAAVERELSKLSEDQREVLVLRLLGGRSYKEIAEITGKKIGTVGWLISEGLTKLSERLAPLIDGAPQAAMAVRDGASGRQGRA
ncbi:MAG: RNA polymerase sigma factor [Planctomycetes bacterium]|nr:RNA polymerase sigma factor [Planctomycetota bacterium]